LFDSVQFKQKRRVACQNFTTQKLRLTAVVDGSFAVNKQASRWDP